MARGEGSDGRGNAFVSSIYQPPRGLIRDLLRLLHLPGQGPLPRPLHSETEGSWVPPPGRVILRQVPGHGVGLQIALDLLFVSVYPRVGIEPSLPSVSHFTKIAGPRVIRSRSGV